MIRKTVRAVFLSGAGLMLGLMIANFAAHAESFDKPLQTKIVNLGRSQYLMPNDSRHVKLRCSYYPDFMAKELDDPGLKGAFIVVVPSRTGSTSKCTRKRDPEEKILKWPGYYGGVKGGLVFLIDADDTDGLGFGVFDPKTGEKVFEDVLTPFHDQSNDQLHFASDSGQQMTVRYLRVVTGDCSLPKGGIDCWSRFEEKASLRLAPMPSCDYHGEDLTVPSVIEYPVELRLFPKPSIKALANPTKCRPTE